MKNWKNEEEMFQTMRQDLYSAVLGDILDKQGYMHQFLSPMVKPLSNNMIVAGRALPVLEMDVEEGRESKQMDKPFGLMLKALDNLQENEVYICSGASPSYALWGALMSTRAIQLGAAGAVLDGYSRDTKEILKLNFPTFSYGRYSQDQAPRGEVVDFRIPITLEKVSIKPGDIIYGDLDGVCVIPQDIEEEVIIKALEKSRAEKTVKKAFKEGMSACEAFAKYGVM